mmetsp:Transcript_89717/g.159448  ORF Transcript_89717/g.159448 Transcript_89717/m.159448 type:complete len:798 (+) Transcript_89717:111-2504(+)
MGQSTSVDAYPTGLKDLLGLGLANSPGEPAGPLDVGGAAHHVKAWRFETRGNCFVEAPVLLSDEAGLFRASWLHRSSSYLILHLQTGSGAANASSSKLALDDFALTAGSTCSPRGLAAPMVSRNETPNGLRYTIFVWNGRSTDNLLRANVESKAYELDSHLRRGLDRQRGFLDTLRKGVVIKGSQDMSAGDTPMPPPEAAAGLRGNRNTLVSTLSASPTSKTEDRQWSRLSRAIMKGSLASRQPTSSSVQGSAPKEATVAVERTAVQTGAVPSLALGGVSQAASVPPVRAGHPLVPRLALGALHGGARQSPPPAASPTGVSDSSTDSSEAMEVDSRADSSSSRKRLRGGPDDEPSPHRTPQTARASPSAQSPAAAAAAAAVAAAPKTARGPEFASPGPSLSDRDEPARPLRAMPALNLSALGGPRQTISSRSDAPAMLNLEDINMSEEELMSSYDPDNEDNNYHLPDHLRRRLQLKHYRQVCSEVLPGALFISSYQVASDEAELRKRNITHIVNTAADICDSCFPDKFQYLTYYLKDANSEEISLLFYRTLEWIHDAISKGGRVLVHCREGVSRSATMIIAYLMWRLNLSFEQAHERIRQVRPICNPNTGFTCQLLQLAKRLGTSGQAAPITDRASLYRVAPYHQKEPFLLLVPSEHQTGRPKFDPRFGWVAQMGLQLVLWMGSQVPDADAVREAVDEHRRRLEFFERCQCSLTVVKEGEEAPLWQVLGEFPPADRASLVALRSEFNADHELMAAAAGVSGRSRTQPQQDEPRAGPATAWEGSGIARSLQPVLAVGS